MSKKKLFALALILVFIISNVTGTLLSAGVAHANSEASDWPMFLNDSAHSSSCNSTAVRECNLLWKYDCPKATLGIGAMRGSPAIVDGIVYASSQNGYVYALDAYKGVCYWNFNTSIGLCSSPAVANGAVYVAGGDNNVYALNASNGAKIWSCYIASGGFFSNPAIADGRFYIGGFNGFVYALDTSFGQILWSYRAGDEITSSPAVAGGVVYIGSDDGSLYALDAASGLELWNFTIGEDAASPSVAGHVVYVGSRDGSVYALDAASGTKIWNTTIGEWVQSTPVEANGVVFVGASKGVVDYSDSGNICALNAATGAEIWSYAVGGSIQSSPAIVDGVVYIGANGNGDNFYALKADTGEHLWSCRMGDVKSSPAVTNGIVYVCSEAGTIYAFGTPTNSSSPSPPLPLTPANASAVPGLVVRCTNITAVDGNCLNVTWAVNDAEGWSGHTVDLKIWVIPTTVREGNFSELLTAFCMIMSGSGDETRGNLPVEVNEKYMGAGVNQPTHPFKDEAGTPSLNGTQHYWFWMTCFFGAGLDLEAFLSEGGTILFAAEVDQMPMTYLGSSARMDQCGSGDYCIYSMQNMTSQSSIRTTPPTEMPAELPTLPADTYSAASTETPNQTSPSPTYFNSTLQKQNSLSETVLLANYLVPTLAITITLSTMVTVIILRKKNHTKNVQQLCSSR